QAEDVQAPCNASAVTKLSAERQRLLCEMPRRFEAPRLVAHETEVQQRPGDVRRLAVVSSERQALREHDARSGLVTLHECQHSGALENFSPCQRGLRGSCRR